MQTLLVSPIVIRLDRAPAALLRLRTRVRVCVPTAGQMPLIPGVRHERDDTSLIVLRRTGSPHR